MDIVNTGPVIKCLAKYLPACQPVMYFICASNEMTNMQLNSDKSEVVMLPPRAGSLFYKYSPTSYLTHTDSWLGSIASAFDAYYIRRTIAAV